MDTIININCNILKFRNDELKKKKKQVSQISYHKENKTPTMKIKITNMKMLYHFKLLLLKEKKKFFCEIK